MKTIAVLGLLLVELTFLRSKRPSTRLALGAAVFALAMVLFAIMVRIHPGGHLLRVTNHVVPSLILILNGVVGFRHMREGGHMIVSFFLMMLSLLALGILIVEVGNEVASPYSRYRIIGL